MITIGMRRHRYRNEGLLGMGRFDAQALEERQRELAEVQAKRQRLEAELARLEGRQQTREQLKDSMLAPPQQAAQPSLPPPPPKRFPWLGVALAGAGTLLVARAFIRRGR